ncbi:PQQ-dependent oxidoreductase, gdhB family [Fulvivirga imtechensis AK7]|uniref:PQQ-dependent oxidoreductase, gdhB family n=1 Tax=Fulvivirga imtechensis AK7 TaxID=1237149 RepID=L8JWK2_9BACT|nr:PQQ-dependent sugar dehydrogenase [Fulvivirga imtechensis]ELR73426.1 PQQ-dependent oxidoreductase, gdhB family [Fulvivirga imtechensis AK7]
MKRHNAHSICITVIITLVLSFGSACSQDQNTEADNGEIQVEDLTDGLNHPWGMAFLPDGRLLVTERSGNLRILSSGNALSEPLNGTPKVFAKGQGGLLDVALDPDFKNNQLVYLAFSEPGQSNMASTAVGRGKLDGNSIKEFTVLFRQEPKVDGQNHFGGRIVFSQDGKLFLTMGERFKFDPAQDLSNHMGAIVRINPDGSTPSDNPFINQQNAKPEIWSYGHRNIESAAFDDQGRLWIAEMGPKGGDELNQPEAGKNHGWPVVSWGEHYDGKDIPDPPTRPEFTDALIHWTPVISPSGMVFYTGEMFPEWQGSLLIGGLTAQAIVRVRIDGQNAEEVERIELGARIRDVEQAPDGSVYVLTDKGNGNIWRLSIR